ncbi:UDP-2-acetamido-2,6-beta-L-arabino-hexul-4-ose reductase [Aliikangiella sp. IMCC44653]
MSILVTGANGFIGKNLVVRLKELGHNPVSVTREDSESDMLAKIDNATLVFHLAGVNRPKEDSDFFKGNALLTEIICERLSSRTDKVSIIYTSSIQAELDNPYGVSKKQAEKKLHSLANSSNISVYNYRLPNVFGKWCKPNYNSAVATFCYNIANDKPVQINDASATINLVYIDDVVEAFISHIDADSAAKFHECAVTQTYQVTVGELHSKLLAFKQSKNSLCIEKVGVGFERALYSTFISYFKPEQFNYPLVKHEDPRGVFVEMLKTKDSGQFSYFTAHPGVVRGGHYHHSKNEKFLVIKGKAKFGFRNIVTDDYYSLEVDGADPQVVETVPGWSHDIKNIGDDEMIVMLWANEVFDPSKPDTINHKVL